MANPFSLISIVVREEVSLGNVVDVDRFCRVFGPICPDHTLRQIEDEVLRAVAAAGGAASWGQDQPLALRGRPFTKQ